MSDTKTYFDDKAALYAAARPSYPPELFAYLASLTQDHTAAWDCATGNGQAALGLAQHFTRVDATDVSENQLANAFTHPQIKYAVHPAEGVPFEDNTFDLINVAQALHWFDFETFWPEVKRVAKPGAMFACYCYAWTTLDPNIDRLVESLIKDKVQSHWAPNNQMCWTGYANVDFPFDPLAAPKFELRNTWSVEQFLDYMHTWSAVRRCMAAEGEGFFNHASQEIKKAWGPEKLREAVTPLFLVVGKM